MPSVNAFASLAFFRCAFEKKVDVEYRRGIGRRTKVGTETKATKTKARSMTFFDAGLSHHL